MADLYQNYTSTSALGGVDWQRELLISKAYVENYITPKLLDYKEGNILEIGCGWGKYLYHLKSQGFKKLYGVDISSEQVKTAKEKLFLENVEKKDALEYLKKTKEKFQVVILIDVLEHLEIEYIMELMDLISNRLNSGGLVLVQVPNGISLFNPILYSDLTHKRSFTVKSLNQLVKNTKFTLVTFQELAPFPHGFKSSIRFVLWKFLVKPLIQIYMLIANGDLMGNIYSSNILCLIRK